MRKTKIIAILNQKGGVGKTTTTRNIAYGFKRKGYNPLTIDADPQGSLSNWCEYGKGKVLPVRITKEGLLQSHIEELKDREDYDYIFIDTPPNLGTFATEIIKNSDLVLVPILPSQDDVDSTMPMISLIQERKDIIGKPDYRFIINKVVKGTQSSKAISEALMQTGQCIKQNITFRQVIFKNFGDGETVYHSEELAAKDSAKEFDFIIDEIMEIINEN